MYGPITVFYSWVMAIYGQQNGSMWPLDGGCNVVNGCWWLSNGVVFVDLVLA